MAAKAEKFNLMDLLNQRSKQKQEAEEQHPAAEETPEEKTEESKQQGSNVFMVDAYDMIPSKDNFYHVDAALKRSIELVGILQPCIVKKTCKRKIRRDRRTPPPPCFTGAGGRRKRTVPVYSLHVQKRGNSRQAGNHHGKQFQR